MMLKDKYPYGCGGSGRTGAGSEMVTVCGWPVPRVNVRSKSVKLAEAASIALMASSAVAHHARRAKKREESWPRPFGSGDRLGRETPGGDRRPNRQCEFIRGTC